MTRFRDGTSSRSEVNAVILRNRKHRLLGTRLFGRVSRRLRRKKYLRLLLLCGSQLLLLFFLGMTLPPSIIPQPPIARRQEYRQSTHRLHCRTLFPHSPGECHTKARQRVAAQGGGLTHINLSFGFREVAFQKKRSLRYFLALELLTGQKAVATLAPRPNLL